MRIRTLSIWKKLKPLWLALIGWLVCSVIMVGLFQYYLLDLRGGLPKVAVQWEQTVDADSVDSVEIGTNGIGLEIAASADIKKPLIQLYGSGYINQRAVWNLDAGNCLHIQLDPYPVTANAFGARAEKDALVMRVLLPQKSYDSMVIRGNRLHTLVYRCRAKAFTEQVQHGTILLRDVNVQMADLTGMDADISLERNRIKYLTLTTDTGNTYMMGNILPIMKLTGGDGPVEILTKNLRNVWDITTETGDVRIGTKSWNQELFQDNLLMQLQSKQGQVTAQSNKKPWKKRIAAALTERELILLQGPGGHILKVETNAGNIVVETAGFND